MVRPGLINPHKLSLQPLGQQLLRLFTPPPLHALLLHSGQVKSEHQPAAHALAQLRIQKPPAEVPGHRAEPLGQHEEEEAQMCRACMSQSKGAGVTAGVMAGAGGAEQRAERVDR
eukprot:CAMPEP_0168349190 /NCGR_PEP_ID=MMETSP0213-20121227/20250_1 /TAXON_ID=151035 /ORGANISM="Euplotes harpa, Strain FSP1.4" /LENGTH=114 /DNA_ID=CAMNT_0008359047 /DNA_START=213 /DNA_END=558 /DNA_ORIENTATION=+